MPPAVRQLLFSRIYDTVQVARHHTDEGLVPRLVVTQTKDFEQRPNMVLVMMRVLAAKATNGKQFVRLKIGRACVQFVGVLMDPWTRHIVLAGTQRCLVQPPRLERRNDAIFRPSESKRRPHRCLCG